MGLPERLNLRWNDFEDNARLSFRKLRDEREFFDVFVVADGGKQVEANKVVLAGGSSFFHKILKENPHPHPLIYLKGVGYKHLVYLLDFVYTGETSIVEDDLNDFLDIAQDLKVKGLTLETHQTTSRASPPTQEAAKEPCPSPRVSHPPHPQCTTPASPAPDHDQVAAEEHGPSLRMLRHSRPQSITSTCPAPHPSQVLAEDLPPPSLSQLQNVKSALPRGQVAVSKTVMSPSTLNQVQVAANTIVSSPHSANSALPQGQVAANETAPSSSRSNPHISKSVLPPGKFVPSLGIQSLCSAISSHLNNASSQSSCEENHDNTFNVKVEVGEGEHYNVVCGANDRGEQYICHVSSRGLEENGGNINFNEEQNDQVISAGKEPKEEMMESRNDMVIREAADVVFEDEEMPHDWYEQGEESENIFLGQNKNDKKNMIPDGEQDLPDKIADKTDGEQDLADKIADKTKASEYRDFQCFLCTITFTTASQLRRHKKSHMNEKQFPRLVRSKMSSKMGSSKKQKIHSEEDRLKSNQFGKKCYECVKCPKSFSLLADLKRHKMTHTVEKLFQCAICSKSFSQLWSLKRHKMIHTGEKPHQCVECLKSFSQLSHLKLHELTHTGEKLFQCALCSKSFSQLGSLKRHNMIHTGEKPHQCVECPKSFSQLADLKRHELTHTGEKPHQCMECPKSFSLLRSLNRHKMTHTGEKPHQCVECPKSFSLLAILKRHKKNHHTGKKPF